MADDLRAEGLVKRYGHIHALRGVDLTAGNGESIILLGPNGAGKSTLLGVFAGRIRPTEGAVSLGDEEPGTSAIARGRTGYLAHASLLYPGLTARENLLFYARLYRIADPGQRADEMLHFMGLYERRDDRVGGFSRGMEQRLAIARCLLHDPRLILLDEPYSGLDRQAAGAFTRTLGQLRDGRRILVIATHDLEAAQSMGDRTIIMNRGRILYDGSLPGLGAGDLKGLYDSHLAGGPP